MGLFGKDRLGVIKCQEKGRKFTWYVPNLASLNLGAYDSPHETSRDGTQFHYHLIICGAEKFVGFYIHYKKTPVPKYSFHFASATGQRLRQHTAHSIPKETERCGHWNLCTVQDCLAIMPTDDSTLQIEFTFDDDVVSCLPPTTQDEIGFEWIIPNFFSLNIEPFSSQSFLVDGIPFVLRFDKRQVHQDDDTFEEEFTLFVFSKRNSTPPHVLQILTGSGSGAVFAASEKTSEMSTQVLSVPKSSMAKALCACSTILVRLTVFRGGNPLENFARQFDVQPAAAVARPTIVPSATEKVGYTVCDDDI